VIEMIPNPLLDRMENIAIAGYITDEKMHIARDYFNFNGSLLLVLHFPNILLTTLKCYFCAFVVI